MRQLGLIGSACLVTVLVGCSSPVLAPSQEEPRQVRPLEEWRFVRGDAPRTRGTAPRRESPDGTPVKIPHSWKPENDPQRDVGWYRRVVRVGPGEAGRCHYLLFEGAASAAEVFVNGRPVDQHLGAFTAFAVDVTEAFDQLINRVDVRVSNRQDETRKALPSSAGRQLYVVQGGLYRPVSLLSTDPVHIDPTDHGSSGVRFRTPTVRRDGASFEIGVKLRNTLAVASKVRLTMSLVDETGATVWRHTVPAEVAPQSRRDVRVAGTLLAPRLWAPSHPALYALRVELHRDGRLVDRVSERVGFRDFRLRPDGRFALNGEALDIRGVGRHQESESSGYAMSEAFIRKDFEALRDLGVNMVRLAHYPQSRRAYDLADEMGILVWAENGNSNQGVPSRDGERITREMVHQLWNHPSVVVWCVGNETNFSGVARYSHVARQDDPQRLVTYASNTKPPPRARRELDFVTFNVYVGWYGGAPIEAWDNLARRFRYISETGAGAVLTNHMDYADAAHHIDTFESVEYAQKVFEFQLDTVFRREREKIPMYLVWVLRDFSIDKYKGKLNSKGLLTRGGRPKDHYFLYRSFLRPDEPLVHITSKTYFLRRGSPDNGIKVYSNLKRLRLRLNGADAGWQTNAGMSPDGSAIANVFHWPVRLAPGRNEVLVTDERGHEDEAILYQWADPPRSDSEDLVQDLTSSNPGNPAVFIGSPVLPEGPFYYELDASADNTWGAIPASLESAHWIATRRLSKPEMRTTLSFSVRRAADVYVVATDDRSGGNWCPGFVPTDIAGWWRDNALERVPMTVLHRRARAGETLRVPPATRDYVVLVKPATP